MRYISVELNGFKRIGFGQIKSFHTKFDKKIQLILGTNGSGKSSLVSELTPLPSKSTDYNKGGYKALMIEHQNSLYEVRSSFESAPRHSFIKDGEELNQSGTGQVQKELVKQHFGITQEIHDLFTSSINFTEFGPAQRRQWFTKLSDVDNTYAINIYQKLKDKLRDIQGALKFNQSRLVQETSNYLKEEAEDNIKMEIEELYKVLHQFMELKTPILKTSSNIIQDFEHIKNLHERDMRELSKVLRFINFHDHTFNIKHLSSLEIELVSSIKASEFVYQDQIKRIEAVDQKLKELLLTEQYDLQELIKERDEVSSRIDKISYPSNLDEHTDIEVALNFINSIEADISSILQELPDDIENKFTQQNLKDVQERRSQIEQEIRRINGLINQIDDFIKHQDHLKNDEHIECPQCKHRWVLGFDENKYNNAKDKRPKAIEKLNELEKIIKDDIDPFIEQCIHYLNLLRSLLSIKRASPVAVWLIDNLMAQKAFKENPRSLVNYLYNVKCDVQSKYDKHILLLDMISIQKLIDQKQTQKNDSSDFLKKEHKYIEEELSKIQSDREKATSSLLYIKEASKTLNKIDELYKRLENNSDIIQSTKTDYEDNLRKESVNEIILYIRSEITLREHKLSQSGKQKAIIDSIQNTIKELEEKQEDLKVLVKEISPSDGLIAQNIQGFISAFIGQMNSFIKKIWTYPLEIFPCQINEEEGFELDYKFPLKVQDDSIVQDISKGSSAMKEVINLAFKIVSMNYLKLIDTPLYLDEFAKTFDQGHRQAAFNVINNLISYSNLPQIFVISHFEDCYGSLKNSDVIVIDTFNLSIPKNSIFNEHVLIS